MNCGILSKGICLGIGLMMVMTFNVVGQDVISDEDLAKYVSVSAQVDSLKVGMKAKTSELVKGNELMDKGRVFNAIKKTKGDSTAIAALGYSDDQLNAYNEITAQIDALKADFKTSYTTLIKEEVGAGVYNKIKKGLKSDEALRERYDVAVANYSSSLEDSVE